MIAKATTFAGSNLQGCRFYKAYLVRTNFAGADLRGASLEDTSMDEANLQNAVATGAYFSSSILDTASVENADFTDAQVLRGEVFWHSGLILGCPWWVPHPCCCYCCCASVPTQDHPTPVRATRFERHQSCHRRRYAGIGHVPLASPAAGPVPRKPSIRGAQCP